MSRGISSRYGTLWYEGRNTTRSALAKSDESLVLYFFAVHHQGQLRHQQVAQAVREDDDGSLVHDVL